MKRRETILELILLRFWKVTKILLTNFGAPQDLLRLRLWTKLALSSAFPFASTSLDWWVGSALGSIILILATSRKIKFLRTSRTSTNGWKTRSCITCYKSVWGEAHQGELHEPIQVLLWCIGTAKFFGLNICSKNCPERWCPNWRPPIIWVEFKIQIV